MYVSKGFQVILKVLLYPTWDFGLGYGDREGGGGKGADVFHIRHSMFVFNIRYLK